MSDGVKLKGSATFVVHLSKKCSENFIISREIKKVKNFMVKQLIIIFPFRRKPPPLKIIKKHILAHERKL